MQIIKIPQSKIERIEKHINDLENKLNVSITLKGKEVFIEGDEYNVYIAGEVIRAIARGFSYKDSLLLKNDNYMLRSINLKDYFGTPNHIRRVKSRIIGKEGSVKKLIEDSTDSVLAIHGSHISVISSFDTIDYALEAIFKLIEGSKHNTVFNYLAKIKKDILWNRLKGK